MSNIAANALTEEDREGSLIVNYIPHDMMEGELKMLFDPHGHTSSIKIIRKGQQSMGFAFVKMQTEDQSNKAIAALDGLKIRNKTMKVSFARKNNGDITKANLYIQCLPKTFSQEDLIALFNQYGTIIESKILFDTQTKQSRQVGFVRYSNNTEANNALIAMNGYTPSGATEALKIKVAEHKSKLQNRTSNRYNPMGGRQQNRNNGGYQQRYNQNQYNNGYNQQMQGYQGGYGGMAGQQMMGGQGNGQLWCLFVYNLPSQTEDNLIYNLFSPFGNVISVKVVRDENGNCKGFGFVNMSNYEQAQMAVSSLDGYVLSDKALQVSFKQTK